MKNKITANIVKCDWFHLELLGTSFHFMKDNKQLCKIHEMVEMYLGTSFLGN